MTSKYKQDGTQKSIITAETVNAFLHTNEPLQEAFSISQNTDLEVQLLARGEYNENYTFIHPVSGKTLVFRVNLGSQMHLENQITYEAHALNLLASSRRTPQVHYVDDSKEFFGHGVLVEDFLPGRSLRYEEDLNIAAHILADVHSVPLPSKHQLITPDNPLKSIVDECGDMFAQYRAWPEASKEALACIDSWFVAAKEKAVTSDQKKSRHIINTELNSSNFLINPKAQSYLVDWEKPLAGEPEQDLAHFLVPTTTFWRTNAILNKKARDQFIAQYRESVADRFDTQQVPKRLQDYLAITCLRGITWSAMALAQHETGQRTVADKLTEEKVTTYLTKDFLKAIDRQFYQ